MVINENEYKKVISNNLRDLAIKRDVTQREIADAVGVSYATVSEWMNGKKIPRMGKIDLLRTKAEPLILLAFLRKLSLICILQSNFISTKKSPRGFLPEGFFDQMPVPA